MARRRSRRRPYPSADLFHPALVAVESPHPFVPARLKHIGDLTEVSRPDGSLGAGAWKQNFAAWHAQPMCAEEVEPLTAQSNETVGELGADACLDIRGKGHAEAAQRFGAIGRVHRG